MRVYMVTILEAFAAGRAKRAPSCTTDGTVILSYDVLPIARRLPNGLVWVASTPQSTTTLGQIRDIYAWYRQRGWLYALVNRDCSHEDCHTDVEMMMRCLQGEAAGWMNERGNYVE